VSAVLRLVDNMGGDGDPPPLEAWELFMRGAGRSERTIHDGVLTMQHLQRFNGKTIDTLTPIDVSRFLARPNLKAWSRAAYFSSISAIYRWWADDDDGVDVTARLPRPKMPKSTPRPISDDQLRTLLVTSMRRKTRVMILLAAHRWVMVGDERGTYGECQRPP
jgi:integrase/recombinase XerD